MTALPDPGRPVLPGRAAATRPRRLPGRRPPRSWSSPRDRAGWKTARRRLGAGPWRRCWSPTPPDRARCAAGSRRSTTSPRPGRRRPVSGEELLVGIDVGTTCARPAMVRAADGTEVAHGATATPWMVVPTEAELARNGCWRRRWPRPRPPWNTPRRPGGRRRGDQHGRDRRAPGPPRPAAGPAIAWHDARGRGRGGPARRRPGGRAVRPAPGCRSARCGRSPSTPGSGPTTRRSPTPSAQARGGRMGGQRPGRRAGGRAVAGLPDRPARPGTASLVGGGRCRPRRRRDCWPSWSRRAARPAEAGGERSPAWPRRPSPWPATTTSAPRSGRRHPARRLGDSCGTAERSSRRSHPGRARRRPPAGRRPAVGWRPARPPGPARSPPGPGWPCGGSSACSGSVTTRLATSSTGRRRPSRPAAAA